MTQENFKLLLTDLYNIYCPVKVKEIPMMLANYQGQEFDAVKTIYFKYNFKSHLKYNPKAGTDLHIRYLLEKYSEGNRVLLSENDEYKEIDLENITLNEKVEAANNQIKDTTEKTKNNVEEYFKNKAQEFEQYFINKSNEIEKKIKELENYKNQLDKVQKELDDTKNQISNKVQEHSRTFLEKEEKIELKLNLNFEESEITLPKEVISLPAGSRFMVLNNQGKICALEIKDIFYDWVTFKGNKCVVEITIEKI